VPARVGADARAVRALRLPGAVTALPVPIDGLADHRGGPGALLGDALPRATRPRRPPSSLPGDHPDDGPRFLRFAAGAITFDLEITVYGAHFDLAGQIHPAPEAGARVEIRTPHVSKIRFTSEPGDFATTGLPHGWFSVVCHRPDHPPIATRWHRVR
jgi:hypothetical protein